MRHERLFIGGRWSKPSRGSFITVIDPSSNEPFGHVPAGSAIDARAAVHAARWAFDEGPWPKMSGGERAAVTRRLIAQLAVRRCELVDAAVHECGAPLKHADAQLVAPAIDSMNWYVQQGPRDFDVRLADHPGPPPASALRTRDPIGVIAALCAGAEPLSSIAELVAPALLVGNTVVLKAPSTAPSMSFVVAEAAAAAELPPGVLNVISGRARDVVNELLDSSFVDAIALNGTQATGRRVGERAGANAKRLISVLGASGNAIVLQGVDLDSVVAELHARWLRHCGQAWGATCRVITQDPDEIADALEQSVKSLVVGSASDPSTDIGPMRSAVAATRARSMIKDAVSRGASASISDDGHTGCFVAPTVVRNVDEQSALARQEVSAPIIAVIAATSTEDAIRIVNDRNDGVHTSVWASSRATGFEVARRLRSASVQINGAGQNPWAPIGGYGRAGSARLRGLASFEAFTESKTIATP
ncbi:MAG: aldehyde dehydrogenase family protein [Actinomycetota bacterium]